VFCLGNCFDMLQETYAEFVAAICRADVHALYFGVFGETQQTNTTHCDAIDAEYEEIHPSIYQLLDTIAMAMLGCVERLEVGLELVDECDSLRRIGTFGCDGVVHVQLTDEESGKSAWESNPPTRLVTPFARFEDEDSHRTTCALVGIVALETTEVIPRVVE